MNLIEVEIILNMYTSVSLLISVLLSSAVYAVWWKISYIVSKYENRFYWVISRDTYKDWWSLGSAEKREKLILLLNCESWVDLQCPENTVFKNLCFLRILKCAGCEEVYTNLFETSSAWQVFKVGVSSVP